MTSAASDSPRVEPIKVIDLFAGAGGFSTGFHAYVPEGHTASPFVSVAAVEFDEAAASTYAANFPEAEVHAGDIGEWDPGDFIGSEVILGGPPCQGFSGLGKEKADDPRNQLWQEYIRVVKKVSPKIFIMENVDRFLRSGQFEELKKITAPGEQLEEYELRVEILNSADYGVPQARKRAIVIGTHKDLPVTKHPRPTHDRKADAWQPALADPGDSEPPQPWVAVGPAVFDRTRFVELRDMPERPGGDDSPLGLKQPGPFFTHELHIRRTPEMLSLARYRAIPPGGNRHDLRGKWVELEDRCIYLSTPSWDAHNNGSGDVMGRMHADRPSVTIRTEAYKPEKGRYLHPTEHRPITQYEMALIQGFPEDFKWHGTKIEIARQIGNAVPIGLAKALASVVYKTLRDEARACPD
ncbi:cytosine methyltransferase [Streptomyces eurocidicus]|uniref:Cytosine-specific methyltransferase n=1 Tax=Streptomyces eurocidicus TaxID=66423 RepID=A0A2N8NYP7_STREU|nr:DNA cytosine methyltransferase [Streptomyces eurocidicus]MBB5121477.1 DNA (cytosine-5)-methyltransferase 1 [Streptomyces eurocidicus]MBF6051079.1 DNA (cytosine-5-)-methyltransferase [Streptomyces eurocidicus]PNE33896.1 cytosine methyltransferase [Streptomyces eurocidicus]